MDEQNIKARFPIDLFLTPSSSDSLAPTSEIDKAFLEMMVGSQDLSRDLLLRASRRFRAAIHGGNNSFEALYGLGSTLLQLYRITEERHFLKKSLALFDQALALEDQIKEPKRSLLHWERAHALFLEAKHSLEPSDFMESLAILQDSLMSNPEFTQKALLFSSTICLSLFSISRQKIHAERALNYMRELLTLYPTSGEGWGQFATVLATLYLETLEEENAVLADEAFSKAAQLGFSSDAFLLSWAKMLFTWGEIHKTADRLAIALDKLAKVSPQSFYEGKLLEVQIGSRLGLFTDRFTLMQKAKKDLVSLENDLSFSTDFFLAFGSVCIDQAIYFDDLDLFYLAIEKFQEGLSMHNRIGKLWRGLGFCFAKTADYEEDPTDSLSKSAFFYAKALEITPCSTYLFEYGSVLKKLGELTKDLKFLERALVHFEQAIFLQKNTMHLFPEALFDFASTLEQIGTETCEEGFYLRAIEILNKLVLLQPGNVEIYLKIALIQSNLADMHQDIDLYRQSEQLFRAAHRMAPENDSLLVEWSIILMNIVEASEDPAEKQTALSQAKHRLIQAAKLGNSHAYYQLCCIYSFEGDAAKALELLQKSEKAESLPPAEELATDSWLETIRSYELFTQIYERQKNL